MLWSFVEKEERRGRFRALLMPVIPEWRLSRPIDEYDGEEDEDEEEGEEEDGDDEEVGDAALRKL